MYPCLTASTPLPVLKYFHTKTTRQQTTEFLVCLLSDLSLLCHCASGYGVGVKAEWSKGGDDTWRVCGSEEGPQGVDPPSPGEIRPERAPCPRHACHIPPRLLCHGHSLWGCYHQGVSVFGNMFTHWAADYFRITLQLLWRPLWTGGSILERVRVIFLMQCNATQLLMLSKSS